MLVDESARNKVVSENLGLVHSLAGRFRGRGIEYDDLFQAGCIGLIKAAENFDNDRGVRFSTYAVPVVLGEIKRMFRDTGPIKVSRALKELSMKAQREKDTFVKREGREPTVSELAASLGVDPEELTEALLSSAPPMSLTGEGDGTDETRDIDVPVVSCEEEICDSLSLACALVKLSDEDRKLIELRFWKSKTQSETAKILNTNQVQVSRREARIIKELRKKLLE